jgi:hypothetical protein
MFQLMKLHAYCFY